MACGYFGVLRHVAGFWVFARFRGLGLGYVWGALFGFDSWLCVFVCA